MRHALWLFLCAVFCFGLLNGCSSSNDEPKKLDRQLFDKRKMPKPSPRDRR